MANNSSQKRNINKSANKSDTAQPSKENASKKTATKSEERSSFFLILVIGFVLMIAYTVWSSINTYSNQLVYDME